MILASTIFLAFLATSQAGCDNSCSGHGACECGFCVCHDNWGMGLSHDTGDCSDRICPFELAWVDHPNEYDLRHQYAECAGRGICNRGTGECECFAGYEGKGCQRQTCPNDCSGHGTCEYLESLTYTITPFDEQDLESLINFEQDNRKYNYWDWDKTKSRGCVCDPQYGDVDCSKRMCDYATDTQDKRVDRSDSQQYQVQRLFWTISNFAGNEASNSFALTFKSKINETFTTTPIIVGALSSASSIVTLNNAIENALIRLPNKVIDAVDVDTTWSNNRDIQIDITFTGSFNQGNQNLLIVEDFTCGDGCFPKVNGLDITNQYTPNWSVVSEQTAADFNSFECGRRGKCDYDTGVCECFEGFTGEACNTCTSLI